MTVAAPIAKSIAVKAKGDGKGLHFNLPPPENLIARISRDRAAAAKALGTSPKEGHLYVPPVAKTKRGPPTEQVVEETVPLGGVVLRKSRPNQLQPWRHGRAKEIPWRQNRETP